MHTDHRLQLHISSARLSWHHKNVHALIMCM